MDNVLDFLASMDADSVELDAADEAAIFLAALQDTCTPDEYNMVMENATELELYGLIPSTEYINEIATEAKKIVYKQTKQMNLNREQKKAAFRLARKANSAAWKKYHKHRTAMIEAREEIFNTYGSRGMTEARKVVQNSRRKASAMSANTVTGKKIVEKMDKKIKEYKQ